MTVPIKCRGKLILCVQNRMFDCLHMAIEKIIEEKNLELSPDMKELIERMNLGSYGHGGIVYEITDYLKDKEDAFLFAKLVKEAIEIEKDHYKKIKGGMEEMQNFHTEIIKYVNSLP